MNLLLTVDGEYQHSYSCPRFSAYLFFFFLKWIHLDIIFVPLLAYFAWLSYRKVNPSFKSFTASHKFQSKNAVCVTFLSLLKQSIGSPSITTGMLCSGWCAVLVFWPQPSLGTLPKHLLVTPEQSTFINVCCVHHMSYGTLTILLIALFCYYLSKHNFVKGTIA